jgi:hypothetical protein
VLFLLFRLLLVIPLVSLSSIVFSLQVVSLLGPRFIIFPLDLLFHSARSSLTGHIHPQIGHIRPSLDISDLMPDISGSIVLIGLNQVSFRFNYLFNALPPSRQISIGIRVLLSEKELNHLERRCRGPRK